MFERLVRTIIIYDNRVYEPVGFRQPKIGEFFISVEGHIMEMTNSTGTKGSRTIVKEIKET
jgi:hypothetical protein